MEKKINITLTEKEFEIMRRAIIKYASEQMNNSQTWGRVTENDYEDAPAIRARIASEIQHKLYKKSEARPELNYISLF